jgi:hypothetical protein
VRKSECDCGHKFEVANKAKPKGLSFAESVALVADVSAFVSDLGGPVKAGEHFDRLESLVGRVGSLGALKAAVNSLNPAVEAPAEDTSSEAPAVEDTSSEAPAEAPAVEAKPRKGRKSDAA